MEGSNKDLTLGSQDFSSENNDVTSESNVITSESKDVTPRCQNVTESKYVRSGSKDMTSVIKNATPSIKDVTPQSKVTSRNVTFTSISVAPESQDITPTLESKQVTLESKDVPSRNKEVTPGNKNVELECKNLKLVCKDSKPESKDVPSSQNKDLISESKKVTFENNETETNVRSERKDLAPESKVVVPAKKNVTTESKYANSGNKDEKLDNKDVTGSGKLLRWSIRRDSLPLVSIRNALLKRRNLSPDNLIWRRRSTGNFAAGSAAGGAGGREVPRSAPATPLQLEPTPTPTPRNTKHEKQTIKPLSGSALSVRATGPPNGTGDTTEGKQPSKSRQKKFQRHFPQVGPEEKVLNYYSCALVGDLLLQGHLYITKNYFAFYSNVFGYVTKLLIPTTTVLRITKEKVARIIPNAVGVCTRDERHVFGSLLSRDSTYKLMTHVWKAARAPELVTPNKKTQELPLELELDASEYSPEDDSSSAGDRLDVPEPPAIRREPETLIGSAGAAAVIQPALLTGSTAVKPRSTHYQALLISIGVLLALSASWLCYKLYLTRHHHVQDDLSKLSGEELYSELVRFRARLHGRAANELYTFLTSNMLLLSKVRQSLEALSGVILTDLAHEAPDSVFS